MAIINKLVVLAVLIIYTAAKNATATDATAKDETDNPYLSFMNANLLTIYIR